MLRKNTLKVIGLVGLLIVTFCCVADLDGHDGEERKGKKMGTYHTFDTTFATNRWPALLQSASGRYHVVNYYDDGLGVMGLVHSYRDDPTGAWTVMGSIHNGLVAVSGPALLEEDADDPNPGRIHCFFADAGATDDIMDMHSDDDGLTWSVPAVFLAAPAGFVPASLVRVLRTDTHRWLFAVSGNPNGGVPPIYSFYTFYTEDGGATFSVPIIHNPSYMATYGVGLLQNEYGKILVTYISDPFNTGVGIELPGELLTCIFSTDRGDTWRTEQQAIHINDTNEPSLYQLDNGVQWCAYSDFVAFNYTIYASSSQTNGYNWNAPVALTGVGFRRPTIVQTPSGVLICLFHQIAGGSIDGVASNDRGATWTHWGGAPIVKIANADYPSLLIDGARLLLFYQNTATTFVEMRESMDDGVTWSAATVISGVAATLPSACRTPNGDLLCVMDTAPLGNQVGMSRSTDDGVTWGAIEYLPLLGAFTSYRNPNIIKHINGRTASETLQLVMETTDAVSIFYHVFVSRDSGETWVPQANQIGASLPGAGARGAQLQLPNDSILLATQFPGSGFIFMHRTAYADAWDTAPIIPVYQNRAFPAAFPVTNPVFAKQPNGNYAVWWMHGDQLEILTTADPELQTWRQRQEVIASGGTGVSLGGTATLDDLNANFVADGVQAGDILFASFASTPKPVYSEITGVVGPTQLNFFTLLFDLAPVYEIRRVHPYTVYSGNHTITPVEGLHDFLFDADGNLTHVYVLDGTSTLASWYAEWEKDEKLNYNFKTKTALETPQILTRWTSRASEVTSGADGQWAAYTFGSAGASFLTDVEIGDRVVLAATGDVLTVVAVNSDVQLEVLETGALGPGLAYEVWRDLPDEVELNRREYEYADDRDAEGQRVFRRFPELPSDNPYFADFGFEVSAPASLDTLAYFYSLDAGGGGEFALAQKGDQVILSDPTAPGIRGQYTIDILGSADVVSVREFFNYTDNSAENQVWRGPQPYRSYYYTLFIEKVRPETIFGPQVDELRGWCYAGGDDADTDSHNFKTKLWQMVPKVYRDRDAHKLTSAPDQVGEYGELHYRDTADFTAGHLERVARMFGHFLQRGRDLIDAFMAMWYPPAAPPEVLDDLTTMLGGQTNRLLEDLPISRRRQFLKIFHAANQRKGRREALIRIARFYGYELEIDRPTLRRHLDSAVVIERGEDGRTTAANWFDAYRASGVGDGDTIIGTGTFQSNTGFFTTSGVKAGDVLTVLGGADAGDYTVVTVDGLVQLTVDPVFPNGSVGQNWEVHAVTPDIAPGDFLYIRDPVDEDENGAWILFTVGKYGYDMEVELPWNAPPLTGLAWEIRQGYPFDSEIDLDSWSDNYAYNVKVRLYRDGVYRLWEHEDTQLVFDLIKKFLPFRITPIYDQEVA